MKRPSPALVAYSSSDSEEEKPALKKKKLPSLASSLATPPPIDRPELHQGRIRTVPYAEGQWASYVYVSVLTGHQSSLGKLLDDVLADAMKATTALQTFWPPGCAKRELHISLSRPIYLRTQQRDDFKKAVQALCKRFPPFVASFATFSELVNDEKTRTFLTMEIGAGHHELQALSNALTPILQSIRQKEFYPHPRFHASIAWALLDIRNCLDSNVTLPPSQATSEGATGSSGGPPEPELVFSETFHHIPHLPKDLVPSLIEHHGPTLSSRKMGTFDVEAITLKIGGDTFSCRLEGTRTPST